MRIRLQFFILGLLVGWWLAHRGGAQEDWPVERPSTAASDESDELATTDLVAPLPVTPARVDPVPATQTESRDRDQLTEIKGIGPTFEHALRVAGITTFAQLAALDAEALAQKLGGRVSGERIRRENWIAQARERARAGT